MNVANAYTSYLQLIDINKLNLFIYSEEHSFEANRHIVFNSVNYIASNKISLNVSKTKYIIFQSVHPYIKHIVLSWKR